MTKFIIDDRIFSVKFSCDVSKCFGACCTLKGAGGAPLLKEEVPRMNKLIETVKGYLSPRHRELLENEGFVEITDGEYGIKSVDDKECVFAYYEEGIAKCSFQRAYYEKRTGFPKPISCHLFPIRIKGQRRNIIRYEELYECQDALDKGETDNITMFEFLEEALVREYGREFFNALKKRYLED